MRRDYVDKLCLLPQTDSSSNEKECSINIKNILKGSGTSESTDWSGGTSYGTLILGTTPSTIEGAMWLSV
ncbi:MAG: hypothetical protein SR3Q1_12690 [Quinella sp. 3Q1]|nr:hypothetical protein [Quinella sp. 3Q1]MBR6887394.1 hypothetical protein [Selenomonadaceae bacterium]